MIKLQTLRHKDCEIATVFETISSELIELSFIFDKKGQLYDKKPGTSYFLAEILERGTEKEGVLKFAQKLEKRGIEIYFESKITQFCIQISCLKKDLGKTFKYLLQIFQDPNINPKTVTQVKTELLTTLRQKKSNLNEFSRMTLEDHIFQHSLLKSANSEKQIKNIEEKELLKQLKALNLANLKIKFCGALTPKTLQKEVKDLLNFFYKPSMQPLIKIPLQLDGRVLKVIKPTDQAYIYMASSLRLDKKDYVKFLVANFIFGGSGFGSRLMQEVRVKRGLAYSVYSSFVFNDSFSYFFINLQTKCKSQNEVIALVQDLAQNFVQNGANKDELQEVKNFLLGSESLRNETAKARVDIAFANYVRGFGVHFSAELLVQIEALKLSELNDFLCNLDTFLNFTTVLVTADESQK